MVLVRFSYTQMRAIFVFYVVIPVALEFLVIIMAYWNFRIMANIMKLKDERLKLLNKEYMKRTGAGLNDDKDNSVAEAGK